jgi:hypothetical protein
VLRHTTTSRIAEFLRADASRPSLPEEPAPAQSSNAAVKNAAEANVILLLSRVLDFANLFASQGIAASNRSKRFRGNRLVVRTYA